MRIHGMIIAAVAYTVCNRNVSTYLSIQHAVWSTSSGLVHVHNIQSDIISILHHNIIHCICVSGTLRGT